MADITPTLKSGGSGAGWYAQMLNLSGANVVTANGTSEYVAPMAYEGKVLVPTWFAVRYTEGTSSPTAASVAFDCKVGGGTTAYNLAMGDYGTLAFGVAVTTTNGHIIVPFATTQASVGLGGAIMDLTGIDAIRAVVTFTDGADETNAVFQLTIGGRVAYRQFP